MQAGGIGPSAAGWLSSLGKTAQTDAIDLFSAPTSLRRDEQKEAAKSAAANTIFPTAPPVNLGVAGLLALQEDTAGKAPDGAAGALAGENAEVESSAAEQFLDYMRKTPEERLRDKILKALGLTEDDVANMAPDERLALEEKIREIVKETIVKADTQGAPERDAAQADVARQQLMLDVL